MVKEVTCRKEHNCVCCERKVSIGEKADHYKFRFPKYDKDEMQVGIEYESYYMCKKPDCKEVFDKLEEEITISGERS